MIQFKFIPRERPLDGVIATPSTAGRAIRAPCLLSSSTGEEWMNFISPIYCRGYTKICWLRALDGDGWAFPDNDWEERTASHNEMNYSKRIEIDSSNISSSSPLSFECKIEINSIKFNEYVMRLTSMYNK